MDSSKTTRIDVGFHREFQRSQYDPLGKLLLAQGRYFSLRAVGNHENLLGSLLPVTAPVVDHGLDEVHVGAQAKAHTVVVTSSPPY